MANVLYFEILFATALFAVAPACLLSQQDETYVSGTVMSHARGFPRFQGIKVAPFSLFRRFERDRLVPIDYNYYYNYYYY